MSKYKFSFEETPYLVETLLNGKKKVVNGDLAFLYDENEGNNSYYRRENNVWVLDDELTNEMISTDENILCNLQKECIEIENNTIAFNAIPIVKKENSIDLDVSEKIVNHHNYLSEILNDDKKYIEKVNADVLKLYTKYYSWILFSVKAIEMKFSVNNFIQFIKTLFLAKRNEKVFMHQIREESTRWLIIRALKLKSNSAL
jgi:hypothetical protein